MVEEDIKGVESALGLVITMDGWMLRGEIKWKRERERGKRRGVLDVPNCPTEVLKGQKKMMINADWGL